MAPGEDLTQSPQFPPLTALEAAFVCHLSATRFHGHYRTSGAERLVGLRRQSDRLQRTYSHKEVVLVRCWCEIGVHISATRRDEFMRNVDPLADYLIGCGGGLFADIAPILSDVARRYALIAEARQVIRPARIGQAKGYRFLRLSHSVYALNFAAKAGQGIDALQKRFPGVEERHLELARVWAAIEPPKGRRRLLL